MADFRRNSASLALALLLTCGAATPVGSAAPGDAAIDINAASLQVDTAANQLRLADVQIRQGNMLIRAAEARVKGIEVNFSNTEWEFRGDVHIDFDGGQLEANIATARFVRNRLTQARATGQPATFQHQPPGTEQQRRGRAATIDYDVARSRVRFEGDVWFTDGRGEFATRAPLDYNLADRSVDSERVQITIRPGALQGTPEPAP